MDHMMAMQVGCTMTCSFQLHPRFYVICSYRDSFLLLTKTGFKVFALLYAATIRPKKPATPKQHGSQSHVL